MLWVYALLTTLGIVTTVPTVLRAIDDHPANTVLGFVAFSSLIAGLMGLLLGTFSLQPFSVLVASGAIGLAVGALHPELLHRLAPSKNSSRDEPDIR